MAKKHMICSCSDERFADFLINHWLKSLKDNVKLKDIDIVIFDYGLNEEQKEILKNQGVILYSSKKDGKVVNIRFRDLAKFLSETKYDQVLSTDGGDIIFQDDISHLFEENKTMFRAVHEEVDSIPFITELMGWDAINKNVQKEVYDVLKSKPVINAGVILGPKHKFIEAWDLFKRMASNMDSFGTDQVIFNYIFYKDGFVSLDSKYNFVLGRTGSSFNIKQGKFYDINNNIIPIVHNVGSVKFFRLIKNFGYGKDHNQIRKSVLVAMQTSQEISTKTQIKDKISKIKSKGFDFRDKLNGSK